MLVIGIQKVSSIEMKKIYVITGPTASGKTAKAIELALAQNGEVINADSRQVYVGLDIGTAKATTEEMKGVRHHLLDIREPKLVIDTDYIPFSVSEWLRLAEAATGDILSRGKVPIVCGGTGFYIDALLYGLPDNGSPDYSLRKELDLRSIEQLNKEYNLNINNKRRLIRAIEILKSGRVIQPRSRVPRYEAIVIDMYKENSLNRETLKARLEKRGRDRIDMIISEIETLIKVKQIDPEWLCTIGIEYKQILKTIAEKDDIIKNIVTRSLQYAKRQITWNKKYLPKPL